MDRVVSIVCLRHRPPNARQGVQCPVLVLSAAYRGGALLAGRPRSTIQFPPFRSRLTIGKATPSLPRDRNVLVFVFWQRRLWAGGVCAPPLSQHPLPDYRCIFRSTLLTAAFGLADIGRPWPGRLRLPTSKHRDMLNGSLSPPHSRHFLGFGHGFPLAEIRRWFSPRPGDGGRRGNAGQRGEKITGGAGGTAPVL